MSISTRYWPLLAATGLLFAALTLPSRAQDPSPAPVSQTPSAKPDATPPTPETPAQIELLETKIRFESNGDSRKEVHTRVRINSELGVRQFSIPQFKFQSRLRANRHPTNPHQPQKRRFSRHPPQRHHRPAQSRGLRFPRVPGRPRQIHPHPRPRTRRRPRIPRHHHNDASPVGGQLLARPLFRSHRRRDQGEFSH